MKFRIKDLENYLYKKVNWREISEQLTLKSFETNFYKDILEVDILPNRYPDSSSIIGLLKEISVLTKNKVKLPKILLEESSKSVKDYFKVINETELVPYYFGRVILNVKNQKSPNWLKEFVEFYGFNSINFLVDLSNFVMIEYGAPLHIFDLDKIKEKIVIRIAKKGEKFISLDNKEFILNGEEIVIADKEKILGLAGIKGGKTAEIDLNTKNIFIEAAVFDSVKIYTTSRKLNLKTDASFRFERKVSPYRSLLALERISSLIQENLGGEILNGILGYQNLKPKRIKFDIEKVKKFSGLKLNKQEIEKILKSLDFKLENKEIILPFDRLDINNEEDIIEEILRIYDLNKIPSINEFQQREIYIEPILEFNNYLRKILIKANYNEAHNYSFISEKDKELFKKNLQFKLIEVLNPISENYKYFQPNLIINLLKSIQQNQFHFKEIRLFEISKIAYYDRKINENYNLGIVFAFQNEEEILKELKGILSLLEKELNTHFKIKELKENDIFNVSGEIYIENEKIGILGLIKRKILEEFAIDLNSGILEINLQKLRKYLSFKKEFKPWPIFAVIQRDLSFFINEKIKFEILEKEIKRLNIKYLQEINLVDIYFTPRKSLTIRLTFAHHQRNLKENEIEEEILKIINYLKTNYQIELR